MKAIVVDKKVSMSLFDIVKFQINFYCFSNNIRISPAQLDTLAYLGLWDEINISDFCVQIVHEEIFSNTQTVRNFIIKSINDNLVVRKGLGNKIIKLADPIELLNKGTVLINLKLYHVEES